MTTHKHKIFGSLLFFLCFISRLESTSIVTVSYDGDRIGNQLCTYIQARWIAHKHNLIFLSPPIPELKPFTLSCAVKGNQTYDLSQYNFVSLKFGEKIPNLRDNIIYLQTFCYLSPLRMREMKKDPIFLKKIREEISPKDPLKLIDPPNNVVSVAVHIRKGGGFDKPLKSVQIFTLNHEEKISKLSQEDLLDPNSKTDDLFHPALRKKRRIPFADKRYPLKFPPEQFYIDQLKKLGEELSGKKVYAFIFTDDQNPKALTERIEKEVALDNFHFDCRTENTGHDKNVLEDLFSMPNFDYLIFPHSTFSNIATLLGDFEALIYPDGFHWKQDNDEREYLVIDKVIRTK